MPAFKIDIDSQHLVTVSTEGLDLIAIRVAGHLTEDTLATLWVSGGSYPKEGESTYLTWLEDVPIKAGQLLTVTMLDSGTNSFSGKTIAELYPDEISASPAAQQSIPEMIAELRSKPLVRHGFAFRLNSTSGTHYEGSSHDHGFALNVLWTSFRQAETARVSLHCCTLESLERKTPLNDYVQERVAPGDSISFTVHGLDRCEP